MQLQQEIYHPSKSFRCRPSLFVSTVIANYLIDIDQTNILFYNLETFQIVKQKQLLTKEDQFCVKIRGLNKKFLVVFGMNKFQIIDIQTLEILNSIEIDNMIEFAQAKGDYIAVMTSDEDGQNKLVYSWKMDSSGKVKQAYEVIEIHLPEYDQCSEDKLQMTIIKSIDDHAKIYVFWRDSSQMVQIDPNRHLEEKYNRIRELTYVTDIDNDTYAEISQNKIVVSSKKAGKEKGVFTNQGQIFTKVFVNNYNTGQEFYSISNKGLKRWKLESNSEPIFYVESQNYPIDSLYFTQSGDIIGINFERKFIVSWKNEKQITINNFPNQIIRKVLKINNHQACLMLEATVSKEEQNEYVVQKYNKMEIYDFQKDKEVAKKAVQKLDFNIDIDSSIVGPQNSIIFILNQNGQNQVKKYIFRWNPFAQDKKKQIKKREIMDAKNFDSIKLYPFDRIATFKKAKEEVDVYDVFGKSAGGKSKVSFFDFSAKKIGEYDLSSDVQQIQMSQHNQLYAIGTQKISIYAIDSASKRLEKIHELETSATVVFPISTFLFMKKDSSLYLYDKEFDLIMKEECDSEDEKFRVLKVDDKRFILASNTEHSIWNTEKEDKISLQLAGCDPNLIEIMDEKHVLVADRWLKSYDFQQQKL